MRSRSPNSNHFFVCPNGVSVQVRFNPPIGSGDRLQIWLIITVFIVWWLWTLGQGHQNLIKSLYYSIVTIPKVWPESVIGSRNRVQTSLFVKIWHAKCWCDIENKDKVTKLLPLLSPVPKICLWKFGQNSPIGSEDRSRQEATRTRTPTPTGSTPKAICPLPFGWGT